MQQQETALPGRNPERLVSAEGNPGSNPELGLTSIPLGNSKQLTQLMTPLVQNLCGLWELKKFTTPVKPSYPLLDHGGQKRGKDTVWDDVDGGHGPEISWAFGPSHSA